MTRPLNLSRPIRCSSCGRKFTRQRGNQRRCEKCTPLLVKMARWERERTALPPDASKPARARWRKMLASPCPHGATLGTCGDAWCRGRVDDMRRQGPVRRRVT